jgi:hypothetical protein
LFALRTIGSFLHYGALDFVFGVASLPIVAGKVVFRQAGLESLLRLLEFGL